MNPNIYQPLPVPGDAEIREILVKRIDQQKQAVGIVVGVIEPDGRRVVAYGNLANGQLPNADSGTLDGDTIFEIGSITKVFTSLLLADMVNRQEVALDDPAAKYLPETVRMPERSGKAITLLDLSTHSSGLPSLPGNFQLRDPTNPYGHYSVDDLYEFLSSYELSRDPGSEFEYSNLGAGLLGHLLAYRAGTDYESLIKTRITQPLNMQDTGLTLSSLQKQRMATGHTGMLAPILKHGIPLPTLAGAGALRSSVNDMLTLLEAFLGYKKSPLAPAMKAMLEVRRPVGKLEMGLGWFINSSNDRQIALHDGGTTGFCSFAGYDPQERIGVVVLANAPSGVDDIGLHILNPKWPLRNPEAPKQRTAIPIDPKLLDNYTGRYQLTPNLVLEITRDGDRLFGQGLAQLNGQAIVLPKFELFAEGEKNFFARVNDSQIVFETGPEGLATSLIRYRAGLEPMPAPRLP